MNDPDRRAAIQQVWTDGDYPTIGELFDPVSADVVAQLDLAGRSVLDAATGTGNTAIHAARYGARVEAADLTPALLDVARERAAAAGVEVRFVEADLVALPWPDASFDVVVSTFGAFLVDAQRACAEELVRVCRPGGRIVTTAWTSHGVFGSMLDVFNERHPVLLEQAPDQRAWSDRQRLTELFEGLGVTIEVTTATTWFPFASVDAALETFEGASGPVQRMRDGVLAEGGDWRAVRDDLGERWGDLARPAGAERIELPAEYAVATMVRV